jgi:hypothetical protein
MGQRQHGQDAAAYSLVRNALTAVQGAFVDTGDYTEIAIEDLQAIEPSVVFMESDEDLVTTDPAWINESLAAQASGNRFGIQVDTVSVSESGYVKVRVVEGSADLGW